MLNSIMTSDSFGIRLRAERQRLNLSQAALARIGSVSSATQLAYETGASKPDAAYLRRVGESGVDVGHVITGVRKEDVVAQSIDWDLVGAIIEAIESWAAGRPSETTATKKTQLLKLLYQHYGTIERFEPRFASEAFKVAS